jgi:methyl-accepting chemotaxis protein
MKNTLLAMNSATSPRPTSNRFGSSSAQSGTGSCVEALPILAGQLQEVASQVEEAVVKVCDSFQDIAQRARQAASQIQLIDESKAAQSGERESGIEALISNTRKTMEDLLQCIDHASNFSSITVTRMESIAHQIDGLYSSLQDIDEVANKSRLLALNGQLEAARAGEQGAAFAIVATETAKMAVHAVDSSKRMRKLIESISESITSASQELHERANTDTREAELSREEVNGSLDAMAALHEEMVQTIEESKDNNDRLAQDISTAVVAMQFQDSISQRIGHVIDSLHEIYHAHQMQVDAGNGLGSTEGETDDWADRMASRYTMASEHKVLASHLASHNAGAQAYGENVELF